MSVMNRSRLEGLVAEWSERADSIASHNRGHFTADQVRAYADELESILAEADGEQEAVGWISPSKLARLAEGYSATIYGLQALETHEDIQQIETIPLYTHPAPQARAEVTDEMVSQAIGAYHATNLDGCKDLDSARLLAMRAALEAALAAKAGGGE